jgi:hypothetical protein
VVTLATGLAGPVGLEMARPVERLPGERPNRLKGWRGVATRYDKHARNYRAGLIVAAIVLFWATAAPDPSDRP